jgi:hypothetical protein
VARKITAQDLKLGVQVCRTFDKPYDRTMCKFKLGRDAVEHGASTKVRAEGQKLVKESKVFWTSERRRQRYR